jgi:hypothetical protein
MAVYAISGILLILEIPIFKTRKNIVKTIAPNLNGEDLGKNCILKV